MSDTEVKQYTSYQGMCHYDYPDMAPDAANSKQCHWRTEVSTDREVVQKLIDQHREDHEE